MRTDCLIPVGRRRDQNPRAIPSRPSDRRGEITGRRSIIAVDVSLSCPLSNSILEGSSGASVTNGRSSSETIVYIRGRLKPISPRTRLREGGRAVSFGIRSLIAERGREGGGGIVDYRVYYAGGILQIYGSNRFDRNHEFQSFDGSEALIVPHLPRFACTNDRRSLPWNSITRGGQIFSTFELTCNSP